MHWYFKHTFYAVTDFVSTDIYHDNCLIEGNHGNQRGSDLCKSKETKINYNRPLKLRLNLNNKKKKSNTLRGMSRGVSLES